MAGPTPLCNTDARQSVVAARAYAQEQRSLIPSEKRGVDPHICVTPVVQYKGFMFACRSAVCVAVASGSNVTVSCTPASTYPESFTITLRTAAGTSSCRNAAAFNTTVSVLCCVSGTAFAKGSGGASTATCLQSVTGTGCNTAAGWLNRFNATAEATPFPIIDGATAACAGGKNVGSINVGCVANAVGPVVSFAAPVQSSVAAINARFYVGCQPVKSCSTTTFGGNATCSGTATSCGGNVALAAQSYPLPCPCSSVNWLYRQSSTGFVTARVGGVCPA